MSWSARLMNSQRRESVHTTNSKTGESAEAPGRELHRRQRRLQLCIFKNALALHSHRTPLVARQVSPPPSRLPLLCACHNCIPQRKPRRVLPPPAADAAHSRRIPPLPLPLSLPPALYVCRTVEAHLVPIGRRRTVIYYSVALFNYYCVYSNILI